MTKKQYVEIIHSGHGLYWDMLGKLRGNERHSEDGLRWLTGDINYNYFAEPTSVEHIVKRMENKEIPLNLLFVATLDKDPAVPFRATGLFKDGDLATGMAHPLMDTPLPKADKRLNLFRVREISQLKNAGAILNAVFEYDLFTFGHYQEMMENTGQFFYLAEYDGLPVGACMAQHGENYVYISWAGTLPGYRKRGIAGYLIQMAEKDGILNGKTTGAIHARPEAIGAYKRIGFQPYCRIIKIEYKEQ